MSRIQGRLALITGASSGIGLSCARRFAQDGANLILWARRKDRLDRAAEALTREFGVVVRVAALIYRHDDLP